MIYHIKTLFNLLLINQKHTIIKQYIVILPDLKDLDGNGYLLIFQYAKNDNYLSKILKEISWKNLLCDISYYLFICK